MWAVHVRRQMRPPVVVVDEVAAKEGSEVALTKHDPSVDSAVLRPRGRPRPSAVPSARLSGVGHAEVQDAAAVVRQDYEQEEDLGTGPWVPRGSRWKRGLGHGY